MNNVLMLIGRVGKDAENRATNTGQKVTSWSLGVDEGYGDKKRTTWFDCVMWGDRGEKLAQYIKKGGLLAVRGRVAARAYTDRDQTPKAVLQCVVDDVSLLGGGDRTEPGNGGSARGGGHQAAQSDLDDEIPF